MSKKHDAIFDDVLSGLDRPAPATERSGTRFLKRSTTIGERMSGEVQEKTLHLVDPARCRMWARHNRHYALLTEENCRDLIDGIKAQGQQEFPAIVRRLEDDSTHEFEVICGARRHFAVSWLRANNYTQFKYLVEVRDLSDEEAFRLADIENRDREDISDYERAIDYADAVTRYYNGKQKAMAARLEVSEPWLSRYLQLAKLPEQVVQAFPSIRDIRERNARELKPLLSEQPSSGRVLEEAELLTEEQENARAGMGGFVDAADVMRRLIKAGKPKVEKPMKAEKIYRRSVHEKGIRVSEKGRKTVIEFDDTMTQTALRGAFEAYLKARRPN